MHYSVYCYVCPIASEIFYVGQDTKYGVRGLATDQHCHGHVQHKLSKLLSEGLQPIITRLCQFDHNDHDELNRAEIYWIAEGRQRGWPLLNDTPGGKVTSGWSCYPETKLKISLANTGKKRTPEQCKRSGDAHRGLKMSEETRAKMSRAQTGRIITEEHVIAILESKASWTPEFAAQVGEKIATSKRGKPRDEETKRKISTRLKGKPWSEARRAAQRQKVSRSPV